jgi:HD superfamily phosphohydrolase YqeK
MADGMLLAFGTETAEHSRDVERIALRVADRVGLSGKERRRVGIAARLHDIGKVSIPRAVLEKPRKLNKKEWKLMYGHTLVGEQILEAVDELQDFARLVRHSHERWDGDGYPDGLSGEEIPLASRIVFCADAFDAIRTDRPYRRGRSTAEALAEIRRCSGTQFEPRVVDALAEVVREDLYGPVLRQRRSSHSHLAMLLVIAVSLGGSVAAGIAAPTSSPPPDPSGRTLLAASETPGMAPGIVPHFDLPSGAAGAVAGAVAHSKRSAAGPQRHRAPRREAAAPPDPAPNTPAHSSTPRQPAPQPKPKAKPTRPLSAAQQITSSAASCAAAQAAVAGDPSKPGTDAAVDVAAQLAAVQAAAGIPAAPAGPETGVTPAPVAADVEQLLRRLCG